MQLRFFLDSEPWLAHSVRNIENFNFLLSRNDIDPSHSHNLAFREVVKT